MDKSKDLLYLKANKNMYTISWLLSISIMCLMTYMVYIGERDMLFGLAAILYLVIQMTILTVMYKRNNMSRKVKYIPLVMFSIIWAVVFLNTDNFMVLTFQYPILAMFVYYGERKLISILITISAFINLTKIFFIFFIEKSINEGNVMEYLVGIATVLVFYIVVILISMFTRKFMQDINKMIAESELAEKREVEKNIEINRILELATENANDILNIVENISDSAVTVASAMEEISTGSKDAAKDIEGQYNEVSLIKEKINNTVEACSVMNNASSNTKNEIEAGVMIIENLISESKNLTNSTEGVNKIMEELKEQSDEIAKIISVISDIAAQTNLLSLNASIEAARAGEMGKGFTVVASEVGELANQCSEATKNIETIINKLQEKVNVSTELVEKLRKNNANQNLLVDSTSIIFNTIDKDINEIINRNSIVMNSINEVNRSSEGIVESISSISAMSEETMANSEETLNITNEYVNKAKNAGKLVNELVSSLEQINN